MVSLKHSWWEKVLGFALAPFLLRGLFLPLPFGARVFVVVALLILTYGLLQAFLRRLTLQESGLEVRGWLGRTFLTPYSEISALTFVTSSHLRIDHREGRSVTIPARMTGLQSFVRQLYRQVMSTTGSVKLYGDIGDLLPAESVGPSGRQP